MYDPDDLQEHNPAYMARLEACQESLARSLARDRRQTRARVAGYFRRRYGDDWRQKLEDA